MDNSSVKSTSSKKDWLLAASVNPEAYFWLAIVLFGTAAAGWLLIGLGIMFALIPVFGWAAYCFFRKRKCQKE